MLFIATGFVADILVENIKIISKKISLPIFVIGIILGIFTSLPELIIGINAVYDNIPEISVGNIFGGIIVMLGLILGLSVIFQKKIITDGKPISIAPYILIIILGLFLGLNGKFNFTDGLIICLAYLLILLFFYFKRKRLFDIQMPSFNREKITKETIIAIICGILIIVFSDLIIKTSEHLLIIANIQAITLGLLIFSIGTNLPELFVAISSFRKKTGELTLSHLLGSAATNILALGVIAMLKPLPFEVNFQSFILIGLIIIGLALLFFFYITDKKLDRKEGFILLSLYIVFVLSQIIF